MRKLMLYALLLCIAVSCGIFRKGYNDDFRTETLIERAFAMRQLDSLCVADTLSADIRDWLGSEFVSYETGDTVTKHVWVKQWGDGTLVKYVVTGMTEPFLVEKTKTYKIEKK